MDNFSDENGKGHTECCQVRDSPVENVCLFESTVGQEDGSGVRALSTKSDNLSLIPRTYMIGENQLLEIVL